MPKKNKNDATHIRTKGGSFSGVMNSMMSSFLSLGANLDFTVKLDIVSIPSIINAAALIVQGNPICGMSLETKIGNITPPRLEPEAITPKAAARFLKNHVPTELIAA